MRTCASLALLGLCPKLKNHPLCGWIFIFVMDIWRNKSKKCFVILFRRNVILYGHIKGNGIVGTGVPDGPHKQMNSE